MPSPIPLTGPVKQPLADPGPGAPRSFTPDAFSMTRGAVRDGAAAVENLGHLLSSRRVGSRAVAGAVPEVLAGCATLRAALGELEAEIVLSLGADAEGAAAARGMLAYAKSRVNDLRRELEELTLKPSGLTTRQRLHLDAVVRRIAADLDGTVRVTDLFGAIASRRSTALDLSDLLEERRVPAGTPAVRATVELGDVSGLTGDPRIVVVLLEFAVVLVARAGVPVPRVVASHAAEGRLRIDIGAPPPAPAGGAGAPARLPAPGPRAAPSPGRRSAPPPRAERFLEAPLRTELPHAAEVILAVARRAGIAVEVAPGGRAVAIEL